MSDVDDKETILDLRYGGEWDMYRLHNGGWCIKFGNGLDDTVHGDTLVSALDAAVAFVPLPKIPCRPQRLGTLIAKRRDIEWAIYDGHRYLVGRLATKTAAEALARDMVKNADRAADDWEAKYLTLVANGTEGVDWRWER
jgi:hypothetical protein